MSELRERIEKINELEKEWEDCGVSKPTTSQAYNSLLKKRFSNYDEAVSIIRTQAKLLEEKDKLLEMMAEYLQGSLNFGVHDATGNINMDIWAKELLAKIAASKTKGE